VSWLPLALLLLALAGCADVISAVFRSTIIQLAVPDSLRGRLAGLQIAVVTGGPRIGDLESGAVASGFGNTVSWCPADWRVSPEPCCWPARCPGSAASGWTTASTRPPRPRAKRKRKAQARAGLGFITLSS